MDGGPNDLRIAGLTTADARSLAATLSTAAIVVHVDQTHGTLLVPHRTNRVFTLAQVASVIDEWAGGDKRRNPVTVLERAGRSGLHVESFHERHSRRELRDPTIAPSRSRVAADSDIRR